MKLFYLLLLAAVLSLSEFSYAQNAPINVIVSTAKLQSFADRVEALGTTKANESVIITPDTSAKITKIYFEDGQEVKKNTLLITLDKSEEEAELRAAEASLSEARLAYTRAKNLENTKALSTGTLQKRLSTLRQGEAAVELVKARIDELAITAPFDGILGFREVSVGALIQPGDMITTIDDLSQIKVDFDIPSVFLSILRPGLPIIGYVEAFGQREFKGEVRTINTQIDPITRTVKARAILPNPDHILKPGLLMNITLYKNTRDALLIPEEALIKRGERNFVYVVTTENGKLLARQQQIVIGGRRPGDIEVLSGIEIGSQVISHGAVKLRDGAEISIRAIADNNASLDELLNQDSTKKISAQ